MKEKTHHEDVRQVDREQARLDLWLLVARVDVMLIQQCAKRLDGMQAGVAVRVLLQRLELTQEQTRQEVVVPTRV